MAALHNRLFIPNVVEFFNTLLDLLNQSSAFCISGDTAEFCSRQLEEYQRTLLVIYRRDNLGQLIEDIAQLVGRRIERLEAFFNDENVMQSEGNQQFNVLGEVRMGYVGRPRVEITQEQIEVLRNRVDFQWADIARMFGISTRTLNRRRQEFGMPLGQEHNFSNLTDTKLDSIVREILSITPQSGIGLVQGALRSRSLRIQRRQVLSSLRRLDPVTSALLQSILSFLTCSMHEISPQNAGNGIRDSTFQNFQGEHAPGPLSLEILHLRRSSSKLTSAPPPKFFKPICLWLLCLYTLNFIHLSCFYF